MRNQESLITAEEPTDQSPEQTPDGNHFGGGSRVGGNTWSAQRLLPW